MSAIDLPFPATTGKASARSWVGAISRRAASRRSLKTYRKVILSLAAAISLFYLYNEVYPTAGNPGWSYLLPRPAGPKVFAFTEPRLAHSQDHLVSYVESHVNADEYLAQSDPSFPPQAPQGLSFVDTDDLEEQQGEFGYFAEDEMLEDGGETDEASHRATKEADQMSSAEKERRTQRKLEHALEIVAKRQEAGQSPGRSLTSLADRNGLPDVYLEAIHAHTEIDISHPDVTAEQVARLIDIVDHTRHLTLRTLIWYLTRGLKLAIGDGPAEMDTLMKSIWSVGGGRGLEIALKHAEEEGQGVGTRLEDRVFWEGWQDAAEQEGHIAIFSKSYCPFSKRAKDIFTKHQMASPDLVRPVVFELDRRSDGPIIQKLLLRLTGRRTVPNVIVDFTSIGGADEVSLMDSEGSLRTLLMQQPSAISETMD